MRSELHLRLDVTAGRSTVDLGEKHVRITEHLVRGLAANQEHRAWRFNTYTQLSFRACTEKLLDQRWLSPNRDSWC